MAGSPTPALFADVCALFGAAVALGVWRRLGGQIVATWTESHTQAVAAEIGAEAAGEVGRYFSDARRGEILEFSTHFLADVVRDARVHAMAANGLPLVAVAAVAGTSQRHARRILAGAGA